MWRALRIVEPPVFTYPKKKLYFTEAEWEAFILGVRDGEFDLDEEGNLPPVPPGQGLRRIA